MNPSPINRGDQIQNNFHLSKRKEAMAKFYLTHPQYVDSANQFFIDNPEQLNEANINWAKDNMSSAANDAAKRLFTIQTEE